MQRARPELRTPWPFQRLAVVLSGGGSLGAYEVGVFKTLEAVGLRPSIVAGVSVGATNAVVWLAHDFHTEALEETWVNLRASTIGMRWTTIALRAGGLFLAAMAMLELLLTLAGSPEFNLVARVSGIGGFGDLGFYSIVLESLAWILVALLGYALASAPHVEELLARLTTSVGPRRPMWWLGGFLILGVALYLVPLLVGIPWAWRFHASMLVVGSVIWLANRPGRLREELRLLFLRLMPETRGRGLWRGDARGRLLDRLVKRGDPTRLLESGVHLILSACSIEDGRMNYFINWREPSEAFQESIRRALGEVVPVLRPRDIIQAAVASAAVPMLFEPVRFRGRDYLDGGVFSNQPIHAVVADGADAVLLVLVSPSSGPRKPSKNVNLVEIGMRLTELQNWRDLQTELQRLPEGWSREGDPARVCVVEPPEVLPVPMFGFDPAATRDLIRQGERDAWKALQRAGWVSEPPGDARADRARA